MLAWIEVFRGIWPRDSANFLLAMIALSAVAFFQGAWVSFNFIPGLVGTLLGWYCLVECLIFCGWLVAAVSIDQ